MLKLATSVTLGGQFTNSDKIIHTEIFSGGVAATFFFGGSLLSVVRTFDQRGYQKPCGSARHTAASPPLLPLTPGSKGLRLLITRGECGHFGCQKMSAIKLPRRRGNSRSNSAVAQGRAKAASVSYPDAWLLPTSRQSTRKQHNGCHYTERGQVFRNRGAFSTTLWRENRSLSACEASPKLTSAV